MNKSAFRHRSVQMKLNGLKNKRIRLNLFDDTEFIAERTHMKKGPEGEYTWSGKLKGPVHGTVHITVFGDGVEGSITTEDGHLYEVNSSPDGRITIEEIDKDKLPPEVDDDGISLPDDFIDQESRSDTNTKAAPAISKDSGDTVDVMVVYTQASRVRWGESGIQSRIINAVDVMNSANADSLVNYSYRLVYMGEVNYVETGDMGDALDKITSTTDGEMDNVHALRDQHGADIVSLIVEDSNYCGIAWVMSPGLLTNNRMASRAFNVTYSSCLSNFTLAHEIGHNEGCSHDRANGSGGSYDYSFGYQDATAGFRTIMSYACPGGGCSRIARFSNPNVNHNGVPTGIDHGADPANSSDNARTKNNNRTIIANWRQAVETTAPQAPGNLNLVAFSTTRIDVSWTDNADNEEGFHLERSPNGVDNWTVIATLTANETNHSDNGLAASTTYHYRVRAYNGVGDSAYSNVDSVTTLSSGVVAPTAGFSFNTSGLTANFTDTSTDSDGTIASWSWNFGDGATSTTQNPSHTYSASGVYTVQLTVTDNDGASDNLNRNVTVVDTRQAPIARFTSRVSGLTVNFTDTSTDSDGTIVSRSWNFGDGGVSTLANPRHTYASGGTYSVRLTVTDNDGKSSILNKNVTVFSQDQAKGILYIYCIIYGCSSGEPAPSKSISPSTPSVSNSVSSSSSMRSNSPGPSSSVTAAATSQAPVTSANSSQNLRIASTPLPLAAPSNLTVSVSVSSRSKTKIATLNWTDNSSNELEFVIERCEQTENNKSCNFVELDKVPANTTTYQDIAVNGNYKYRVKARNRIDDSANSKEVNI